MLAKDFLEKAKKYDGREVSIKYTNGKRDKGLLTYQKDSYEEDVSYKNKDMQYPKTLYRKTINTCFDEIEISVKRYQQVLTITPHKRSKK
jgi:hypothetical protein